MKFLLKRFLQKKDGVTAVEFAILAPLFFLLFLGIIEVGLTTFVDSGLNAAIRDIARAGVAKELSAAEAKDTFRKHLSGLARDYEAGQGMRLCVYDVSSQGGVRGPHDEMDKLKELANTFREGGENARNSFFNSCGSTFNTSQSGNLMLYAVRYDWGGFSQLVGVFLPKYLYALIIVRNEEWQQ